MRARSATFLLGVALAGATMLACEASAPPEHEGAAGAKFEACATCHMADYQSARGHVGKRPTTCPVCHSEESWHPTHLVHPWPLTGKHLGLDCFECHKGQPAVFKGTPKACVGCHRTEYEKAPGHLERFPTTCEECHATYVWKPAYWVDAPKTPPQPAGSSSAPPAASSAPPTPTHPAPVPTTHPTAIPTTHPTTTPTTHPTTTPTTHPTTAPTPPDTTSHPSPIFHR